MPSEIEILREIRRQERKLAAAERDAADARSKLQTLTNELRRHGSPNVDPSFK